MALKTLLLRSKIDAANKRLEALRAKDADFDKREADTKTSIEELAAKEDATDEERSAVEKAVEDLDTERDAHDKEKADLEGEIQKLNDELADQEKATAAAAATATPAPAGKEPDNNGERKDGEIYNMETRSVFKNMSMQERTAFMEREDTKKFMSEVRSVVFAKDKRAVTGASVTIPEVMLPLIMPIIDNASKLKKYVNATTAKGTGRQPTMGTVPTAIWVESTASIPELALAFNSVTLDGFKVCGYFAIPNSTAEDSDEDLIAEFMVALGEAIGKGYDKAIVYGTGSGMPMGFVTRLAQATKPADYPAAARAWVELDKTNVLTITGKTGADLFAAIATSLKPCVNDYVQDGLVFVMSEATRLDLIAQSIGKNSNALIVAGMNSNVMPVIGGAIETCNFMANGDIAYGYGKGYKLLERKGLQLAQSTEVKFIEDQTVVKGTARADGEPVIAEAFGILNINGTAPTTSVAF